MHRPVFACLFVVLSLLGCGKAAGPSLKDPGPAQLPEGWTAASDSISGVSLGIPSGWRKGLPRASVPQMPTEDVMGGPPPPMDPALSQLTQGMEAESEKHEQESLAKMREKDHIVLHCVDGSKTTIAEEPTRIYVKHLADAGFGSLEEAAIAEKQDSHQEMKTNVVDLPVGKAMRMEAKGRNRIGDEECHVSYVFLDGSDAYVLRFASTNNPQVILDIDRWVAATFRVAPRKK